MCVGERCPDQAVDYFHPQLAQADVLRIEVIRHAALAADAAAERGTLQVTAQAVVPLVIGTQQVLHMPLACLAELYPAMSAAVFQHADLVRSAAHDNDRTLAQGGRLEVPDLGDFGFQRAEQPVRAIPDPLQFRGIHIRDPNRPNKAPCPRHRSATPGPYCSWHASGSEFWPVPRSLSKTGEWP